MRAVLMLVALVVVSPAVAAEPATLKARAALALAFAAPDPARSYPEAYTAAVKGGKPLVVFVGQPVRELPGCVCVGVEAFPNATPQAVVVGLPAGVGLRRIDLPGRPSDGAIRAAAGTATASTAALPAGR